MSVEWPDEDVYQRTIQLSVVAGATLSGHRIVSPNEIGQMEYASSATLVDKNGPFWLTLDSAVALATVRVLVVGPITEPSWTWVPDEPICLGMAGSLTQSLVTYEEARFGVKLGMALDATNVFFDPEPAVILTP